MFKCDYVESEEEFFERTLYCFVETVGECSTFVSDDQIVSDKALDRFVLLANDLAPSLGIAKKYIAEEKTSKDAELLLLWLRLGAVTEYALAIFLAIYPKQFKRDVTKVEGIKRPAIEKISFDELIKYYKSIAEWSDEDIAILIRIKDNRNAIHLIKNADVSSWSDYLESVEFFFSMLKGLLGCLPDLSDLKFSGE